MSYFALLHTHETLVFLYLIIFLIKLGMLLADNQPALATFRRKTKVVGEMVLPTLFIISGVWLAILSPQFLEQHWFIHKLVLLVIAIVTGIITFRKNSKLLGILTLLIFAYIVMTSYSKSENPFTKAYAGPVAIPAVITNPQAAGYNLTEHGKYVYLSYHCIECHGPQGDLGHSGAANLVKSNLDSTSIVITIKKGRKNMPSFNQLSEQELNAVAHYVLNFRKASGQ